MEFYEEVCKRTAQLVAGWQCVGFCHGKSAHPTPRARKELPVEGMLLSAICQQAAFKPLKPLKWRMQGS